jgi:hypothetical protein
VFQQICFGQGLQHGENLSSLLQHPTCQVADNKWVAKDLLVKEQAF